MANRSVRLVIEVKKGDAEAQVGKLLGSVQQQTQGFYRSGKAAMDAFARSSGLALKSLEAVDRQVGVAARGMKLLNAETARYADLQRRLGGSGGFGVTSVGARAALGGVLSPDNGRRFAAMTRMGVAPQPGYAGVLANALAGFGGGGVNNRVALASGSFPAGGNTGAQLGAIHAAITALHATVRGQQGAGTGGGGGAGGGGRGFLGGSGAWNPLRSLVNLGTTIYIAERAVRSLLTLLRPFQAGAENIFSAGEDARKFVYGVSGPLGDVGRGWDLNRAIINRARTSVATVEDLREAAKTLAYNPALSSRLTFAGGTNQQLEQVASTESLTRRLGILDPAQAQMGGAVISLRELAEGGQASTRSLRMRFGITSRTLARQIVADFGGDMSKALAEIQSNPTAAITALTRYVDAFVPNDAAERMGHLVSVRWAKIVEAMKAGMSDIAESGVFDDAVEKLKNVQDSLFAHLGGPEWDAQAKRISTSLSHVLDNVGKMVVEFLRKISGTQAGGDTVGGVVGLATSAIENLARASDALPDLGKNVGSFIHGLAGVIEKAVNQVERLTESIENFSILQGLYDGGKGDVSSLRREAAFQLFDRYGIKGARTGIAVGTETRLRAGDLGMEPYDVETRRKVLDLMGIQDPQQRTLAAEIALRLDKLEPRVLVAPSRLRSALGDDLMERLQSTRAGSGMAPVPRAPDALPSDVPESVRRLIKAEFAGLPYGAMLKSLGQLTGSVDPVAEDSALAQVVRRGRSVFATNISGDEKNGLYIGGVFARMRQQYSTDLAALDKAIREGEAVGSPSALLLANLGTLKGVRGKMPAQADEAEQAARDQLAELAQSYGQAVSANLADLPPFAAAELQREVSAGTTSLGRDVANVLARAGRPLKDLARDIGTGGLPLSRQQQLLQAQTGYDLGAIQQSGETGRLNVGMTAGQIRRAFIGRPNAVGVAGDTLNYIRRTALPAQATMIERLRGAYGENPDEANYEALAKATAAYGTLLAKMREAQLVNDRLLSGVVEFGDSAQRSIEDGLGQAINNAITGTGKLSDAFRSMASTIISEFSRIEAKLLVESLVGSGGDSGASGIGGFLGRLLGLGNAQQPPPIYGDAPNVPMPGNTQWTAAAKGAVWPGFSPFAAFSDGGIVHRPTIGIIGERRDHMPEAVLPLGRGADGQLGVLAHGRGGNEVHVHPIVVADMAEAEAARRQILSVNPAAVVAIISRDIQKGGKTYEALRRKV